MKKTQAVVDFIKIPKDFKSLKDLGDLVGNYDIVSRLSNALNDYQKFYVESMMFDFYNINDYIPEKNHKLFEIGYSNDYNNHLSLQDRIFIALGQYGKIELSKNITLQNYFDTKNILFKDNKKLLDNIRLFVNLKRKKIYFALWLLYSEKYFSNIKYKVDTEKHQLIVTVPYMYTYKQLVGGVRISTYGGNGYYTGGKTIEVPATGHIHYIFCTKTNLFLDMEVDEEQIGKANIEAKSRY